MHIAMASYNGKYGSRKIESDSKGLKQREGVYN
jgi:hypothetical protein